MINLIKNELTKIFKKKSIYITLIVVLGFVILTNVIYNYANNYFYTDYYYSEDITLENKKYLNTLDPEKSSDIAEYLSVKTDIDMSELINNYDIDSWQANIINSQVYSYLYDINRYTYGADKNDELLKETGEEYTKIIERLDNDDWRYFAQSDLDAKEISLNYYKEQKNTIEDITTLRELDEQIFYTELEIEMLEIRLSKNISYGDGYLNNALGLYQTTTLSIRDYEQNDTHTYDEKQSYYWNLEEQAKSKYMLDNEVDLDENNLRQILMNFFTEYDLFIVIIIVMIAGSIVSDEFSKGTVKLWLVRPHTRTKLLLAKFITAMIIIVFAIVSIAIMQLIIGGIFFGFDSLKTPAVVYNFNKSEVVSMNVFSYMGIQGLAQLPFYILIATIAFAVSTIFASTSLAITISILGYMSTSIINMLVQTYNIKFMKFFITMNWDLNQYLFGGLPDVEFMSFGFSIVMCIVYFVLMIIPTFIIFKKKNIKNV